MPLVGAAALLHTDAYLTDAKKSVRHPEHLVLAVRLLAVYTGAEVDREFKRELTLVNAWLRQISGDFSGLRTLLVRAREEFPDDSAIAMAEGCLEEAAASPRAGSEGRAREALVRAAVRYQRALDLDGNFEEARVRLGYVLLRLGQFEEAQRELERASRDTGEPPTVYLAHIFVGLIHELEGRAEEAVAAYREAHARAPDCQVAAIALSHALYRAGDRAASATIAREAGRASASACEDPWWSYDYGQAWKIDQTMDRLRRTVHQ